MTISKPMLAGTVKAETMDKIVWPGLASNKIDGIRCLVHPELGPVSRTFKPIPNHHIRQTLQEIVGDACLDGELVAVSSGTCLSALASFQETMSTVMSRMRQGNSRYMYLVFDCFANPSLDFLKRIAMAQERVSKLPTIPNAEVVMWPHTMCHSKEDFFDFAAKSLEEGYEGTMLRSPDGPYKEGRSTLNQGWLLKFKPWADAEGTVKGFEELMHNANEQDVDAFGYSKRSSKIEGMVPMNTLGALVLNTEWGELRVGSGFDMATRDAIWADKEATMGRKVTFKYQEHGFKDKPRFPIFMRFREEE